MKTIRTARVPAAILLAALVAGCATTQSGWRGQDAAPFDGALDACSAEADAAAANGRGERERLLEDCMARQGWRRDPPRAD